MTTQSIIEQFGSSKTVIAFYDGMNAAECPLINPIVVPDYSAVDGVEEIQLNTNPISGLSSDVIEWSNDNEDSWVEGDVLSRCDFLYNVKTSPYANLSGSSLSLGLRSQDVVKCGDITLNGNVVADFGDGSQQTSATLPFVIAGNSSFWQGKGFSVRFTLRYNLPNSMVFEKNIRWEIDPDSLLPLNITITQTDDLRQLRQVIVKRSITHNVCGSIVKKFKLIASNTQDLTSVALESWQ